MLKAVMYGAGNIGRGFIGQLLSESGYEVTFVDVNQELLARLNTDKKYPVKILYGDRSEERMVEHVSGIDGRDIGAVAEAIAEADLMATAVGVNVLPRIVEPVVAGLKLRCARKGGPLNIIICENLLNADRYLKGLIGTNLMPEEYHWMLKNVGFVEASIGRMVPIQTPEMQEGNPLRVCVESYASLPVDKAAFVGEIPDIKGLVPFSPFAYYIERKLFIHNMGHAMTAYLGNLHGDTYIWEAIGREDVHDSVRTAMLQSAAALSKRHQVEFSELEEHIEDLLHRFANRQLGDTVQRVGQDLRRKLSRHDRMVGALNSCIQEGLPSYAIATGIAAALLFDKDPLVSEMAPEKILTEISELQENGPDQTLILERLAQLESKFPKKAHQSVLA